VIERGPPGRGRIKTFVRAGERLPKVWEFMREQLAAGRQGYIVYSRLEEEDTVAGIKAVTKEFESLRKIFEPWKIGLLHGRLKEGQKDQVMAAFQAKQTQVLLATSIIEVGVDVANATVMVIENAELFGLAQLHGFRIAEEDMKLRGPGDFLGREQSGAAPLRFGDLARDGALVERARALVRQK
jgi:ATP-dependent DNA helicase RecG